LISVLRIAACPYKVDISNLFLNKLVAGLVLNRLQTQLNRVVIAPLRRKGWLQTVANRKF